MGPPDGSGRPRIPGGAGRATGTLGLAMGRRAAVLEKIF
jgi:hypothetical protein